MEITSVIFAKDFISNKNDEVKAFVDIIFDNCFVIHGIKVIKKEDESLFIAMPSRKLKTKAYVDVVHPITKEFREYMTNVILEAYKNHLDNMK